MSALAQAARPAPGRAKSAQRRRTWLLSGGVFWIVLLALLLTGVVAVNVAVLRLNLQLDHQNQQQTQLHTDIARLRSEISTAAATHTCRAARTGRARSRPGTARGHDLHRARQVRQASANRRIVLLAAAFLTLLAAAFVRAVWIQVVRSPEYTAMALRQHRETVVVPAGRGTIVDRNGEPLAIGKLATTVYADPRQVNRPRDLTLAAAKQLRLDPAALYPTLVDRSRGFVYVARKADPHKADNLKALDFAGVGFYPEEHRYYPQGPRRLAGARLRGARQQGPRRPRAVPRRDAVGPSGQPDDREGPVRPRARRRRDEARGAGQERPADDRPRHPVERGGRAAGDRAPLGSARGDRRRHGSAHGGDPGDGEAPTLQRQPVPDDASRSAPEPGRHGHVRAGVDLQARDHRGGAARTRSSLRARRSGSHRRSRSRTA